MISKMTRLTDAVQKVDGLIQEQDFQLAKVQRLRGQYLEALAVLSKVHSKAVQAQKNAYRANKMASPEHRVNVPGIVPVKFPDFEIKGRIVETACMGKAQQEEN
ncbi:hypothetical protein Dalk_2804 [Desulfatibacillum aliphaticivorans]|uniref:Uncharacterized protein n=1 Tax=Desulfatibacillum aliphaticivorans TaxID=218208 RepID=B8FKX3_DESAL|nr:hypothetical protein [Desulfatibacillum aliphaticivorans]ACL04495.1 hypothetical protein Dalk_2804 [Desulfatibacillum aliphaticivorans]